MKPLPCLLALFLLHAHPAAAQDAPAAGAPAAAEKMKVKLDRPFKTGEKYTLKVEAAASQSADISIDGDHQPAGSETMEMNAEGTLEVTGATEKTGNLTSFRFTLSKFSVDRGKGADSPLKEGAVIEVKLEEDKPVVSVDGAEPDAELRQAILAGLPTVSDAEQSDDLAFGTGAPRAPGESWKCDSNAVAKYFENAARIKVDADGTSATTRLVKKTDVDGVPCMVIGGTVQLKITAAPGLPEKADLKNGTSTMEVLMTYPLDESLPPLVQKIVSERSLELEAPIKGGGKMKLKSSDRMERKMTWKKQ